VNLEDEEGLSQEFHNVFLDRTFEKEREDDIHMENDLDSAEHIRPPLEEFDKPAPRRTTGTQKTNASWIGLIFCLKMKIITLAKESKRKVMRRKRKKEKTHLGIPSGTNM
jgi:hypothetical protein